MPLAFADCFVIELEANTIYGRYSRWIKHGDRLGTSSNDTAVFRL